MHFRSGEEGGDLVLGNALVRLDLIPDAKVAGETFDLLARTVVSIAHKHRLQTMASSAKVRERAEDPPVPLDVGPGGDHDDVDVARPDRLWCVARIDPPVCGERH